MSIHVIMNIYRNIETGEYLERWCAGATFKEACDVAIRKAAEDEESRKVILVQRTYCEKEVSHETDSTE